MCKYRRTCFCRLNRLLIFWNNNILNGLPDYNYLCCPRFGMGHKLTSCRPVVSLVVVIDIAQQEAFIVLMNDNPNAPRDPHRPEILVLRLVELVETHARVGRVEL